MLCPKGEFFNSPFILEKRYPLNYNKIETIQKGGDGVATVKDVAKEAGVSVGTVSRYLNGAEIKEQNRIKIEEAIVKLDFKLNPIARYLKTNRTHTIGVIIPTLSDIYATTIVRNLEKTLYDYGYNIIACDSWGSSELEMEKVQLLADRMVDGLILYPCNEDISYLEAVNSRNIPVVIVDSAVNNYRCDQVLTDNSNAIYEAVRWLVSNNHKRIGIISASEELFTSRERVKGYYRALEDYRIEVDGELVKTLGYNVESGYQSMIQFLQMKNPPTAVIASNYYTTIGTMKAIYDLNIAVPEQVSIIGFDNLGLTGIIRPALTIIVQPMEEIGKEAAELLVRRIRGDYDGFPAVLRLKTELILRNSTAQI